jgi:prepilin-type N-terminal cleavage/methylation domain-containing protein
MRAPGYTLVELLAVVAILAVAAVAVMPLAATVNEFKLDAAAEEAANALRYARAEALRTGTIHGVDFSVDPASGQRKIRVFRTNPSPVYDVYHPLDKRLYGIDLSAWPATQGVVIAAAAFRYFSPPSTYVTTEWAAFDASGNPAYYPDAAYSLSLDASSPAQLTLTLHANSRKVQLAPTGRVTLQ